MEENQFKHLLDTRFWQYWSNLDENTFYVSPLRFNGVSIEYSSWNKTKVADIKNGKLTMLVSDKDIKRVISGLV